MTQWAPDVTGFSGPKYLALVHALEKDMRAGRLAPGDRLPPQREIAENFGVTIATVTKAFSEAQQRGLVKTVRGSGTYVAEKASTSGGEERLIDLSLNILPVELVSDEMDAAMSQIAGKRKAGELFSYTSYHDQQDLCALALDWLRTVGFTPSETAVVFPCHGGQHGIFAAFAALARPGDTILCEQQTYTGALRLARQLGLRIAGLAMDEDGIVPDALDKALRDTGAQLVYAIPTLQNPTGATMSQDRRRQIATIISAHEAFLIADETQLPLAGTDLPLLSDFAPDHTVVITGFSKCVATGIRFGFATVPSRIERLFHEALLASAWLAPSFYPNLIATMVRDNSLTACLLRHRQEAAIRQELATATFADKIQRIDFHSYHQWLRLEPVVSIEATVGIARALGVKIAPTRHFCVDETQAPQAIRLCLGAESDRDTFAEGLKLLKRALAGPSEQADIIF